MLEVIKIFIMNQNIKIHPKMSNHFKRFNYYKQRYNYSPKKILDIGALDGRWSLCLKQIYENSDFMMIEANSSMESFLIKTNLKYIISPLSDKIKKTKYYKIPGDAGNSLYIEKDSSKPIIEEVLTSTLEDLLDINDTYNIIKLDVQGSELDILNGGKTFLEKADFILTECSLIEYNIGAPLFNDQLFLFQKHNYSLVDVIDLLYDKKGTLIQMDILFQNNKFNLR